MSHLPSRTQRGQRPQSGTGSAAGDRQSAEHAPEPAVQAVESAHWRGVHQDAFTLDQVESQLGRHFGRGLALGALLEPRPTNSRRRCLAQDLGRFVRPHTDPDSVSRTRQLSQ